MKKSELKQLIREEIKKIRESSEDLVKSIDQNTRLKSQFGFNYGHTKASLKSGVLTIVSTGNMGSTIKDDVNPDLKGMGLPTIEELKSAFKVISEKGSPDYMYVVKFKVGGQK